MAPSLIVMVREAVVVSATHGGFYLLIHCSIAQWAHSGQVFSLYKYSQYTHLTKKPDFAHCALFSSTNYHTPPTQYLHLYTIYTISNTTQYLHYIYTVSTQCPAQLTALCWQDLDRGGQLQPRRGEQPDRAGTVLYCTVLYCTVLYCTVLSTVQEMLDTVDRHQRNKVRQAM